MPQSPPCKSLQQSPCFQPAWEGGPTAHRDHQAKGAIEAQPAEQSSSCSNASDASISAIKGTSRAHWGSPSGVVIKSSINSKRQVRRHGRAVPDQLRAQGPKAGQDCGHYQRPASAGSGCHERAVKQPTPGVLSRAAFELKPDGSLHTLHKHTLRTVEGVYQAKLLLISSML